MRFGAEELFKEDKNDEESKKRLLSMDIDEILERAEQVEDKQTAESEHELLGAFKASSDFFSPFLSSVLGEPITFRKAKQPKAIVYFEGCCFVSYFLSSKQLFGTNL